MLPILILEKTTDQHIKLSNFSIVKSSEFVIVKIVSFS